MGIENKENEQLLDFDYLTNCFNCDPSPLDFDIKNPVAAAEHTGSSLSAFLHPPTFSLSALATPMPPVQSQPPLYPNQVLVPVPSLPRPSQLVDPNQGILRPMNLNSLLLTHQEYCGNWNGMEQNPIAKESEAKRKPNSNGPAARTRGDLEPHLGKSTLEQAASSLKISRSTLKRRARENGIARWPSNKKNKGVDSSVPENPNSDQKAFISNTGNGSENPNSDQNAFINRDVRIVKVKYKEDFIKFELSSLSTMAELQEKVSDRLPLDAGRFEIKYLDEDGDPVLLVCDDDLKLCMRPPGHGETTIKMLLSPATT